MKNYFTFLTEATAASDQAKRLALAPDGHGGWYNRATGEFEAKTVNGKLQFYNKRQRIPGKDPKQTPREKEIASNKTKNEIMQINYYNNVVKPKKALIEC